MCFSAVGIRRSELFETRVPPCTNTPLYRRKLRISSRLCCAEHCNSYNRSLCEVVAASTSCHHGCRRRQQQSSGCFCCPYSSWIKDSTNGCVLFLCSSQRSGEGLPDRLRGAPQFCRIPAEREARKPRSSQGPPGVSDESIAVDLNPLQASDALLRCSVSYVA